MRKVPLQTFVLSPGDGVLLLFLISCARVQRAIVHTFCELRGKVVSLHRTYSKQKNPYGFTLFIIKEERFIYTGLDLVNQVVPGALSFLPPSLPFPIGGARRSRAPPAARGAGASSLKRGRRSSPASS